MTDFKSGDQVVIECAGDRACGRVILASPNGASLMLEFEAILAGHVGMMPVLRDDTGYRSVATGDPVIVQYSSDSLALLRRLYHHVMHGGTTTGGDEARTGIRPLTAENLSRRIQELERQQRS